MAHLDVDGFLERMRSASFYAGQIQRVQQRPGRDAVCREVAGGLREPVRRLLAGHGIDGLYLHQADAVERAREGRHLVVVTATASGKTLCYQIPILEALEEDPLATALCLFPTKALAQDQLRSLLRLGDPDPDLGFTAGTYDGDTPPDLRRRLRDRGNVILTNPDMLHAGILPNHARWSRFFSHLRYVVIDEVHAYRGVFGSHLANVVHRLHRVTRHYGAAPVFLACSATIANPGEHASSICGVEMETIDRDGSPQGPKTVVMWNPPRIGSGPAHREAAAQGGAQRRSPLWEVVHLFSSLVGEGIQTIAFTRTRLAAELVAKNAREILRRISRRLARSVHAYRGGYLPEERREIERRLAERDLLGVASTNALELGIDIGSLSACVILGYPGTIASLWQQAGRAGRTRDASLVFLVAQNTPVDQFLMSHGDWLFARSPERAHTDPENPHVAVGHLRCATRELPLPREEALAFGPASPAILEFLEDEGETRRLDDRWYWASTAYPAAEVGLRNIAGPVYTIQDELDGGRVIGTQDEMSALTQLHDHAVYLHAGETWIVNRLDLGRKIARVERRDLDYYTQAVQTSAIRIDEVEEEGSWREARTGFGDVTVTTSIPMFKKVRYHSRESVGFERLELPPQELETTAMWLVPPKSATEALETSGHIAGEALIGIANVLTEVVPVFLMCDAQDIGAVVDAAQTGREALFLYDRFPGGMGYARGCLDRLGEVLETVRAVIEGCPCEVGCPSCVGSAVPPFAMGDLDSGVRGRIPDKEAARALLTGLSPVEA